MAYRGPQEQAQAMAPSANNGNPNGVHNVSFDNKNYRYTPPTVDNEGRVTNSDLLNFNLPRFGNQASLMGLPPGMSPSQFLRAMFPGGSMVPGGDPFNPRLQGRTNPATQPTTMPATGGGMTRPGGAPGLNIDNPMGTPGTPSGGYKPAWADPANPRPTAPRPGGAPGQDINWQGNNSGVQQGAVGPNSNWDILTLLANRGGNNMFDWVRQYRDQRLAAEGTGMSPEQWEAMQSQVLPGG